MTVVVVIIFSIVQSIFGVGLLLFGTPTLLLLGFDFEQSLWTLLPSSVAISLYQIIEKHSLIESKKEVYLYTLPALAIGVTIVITSNDIIDIKKIVGLSLLVVGAIRLFDNFRIIFEGFIKKYAKIYLVIMGGVHGVSNMGGGMLTILMSSIHARKEVIQVNVAYTYFLFGLTQLMVLGVISDHHLFYDMLKLVIISSLVYYLTKKYIAHLINDLNYQLLITYLILIYGILVLSD